MLAASRAGTGYVIEAERPGKSRKRCLTPGRGKRQFPASLAEQIVEAGHDAVAAQPDAVVFRRPRHDLRSVEVVAAAKIGVHVFQAERELARQLDLEGPADPCEITPSALSRMLVSTLPAAKPPLI